MFGEAISLYDHTLAVSAPDAINPSGDATGKVFLFHAYSIKDIQLYDQNGNNISIVENDLIWDKEGEFYRTEAGEKVQLVDELNYKFDAVGRPKLSIIFVKHKKNEQATKVKSEYGIAN